MPTEISVSIVAVPCLRFTQAALWNGQAAHSTTGVTSCSDSHWKLSNCSAGIMAISRTGTDRTAATIRRRRSAAVSSGTAAASGSSVGSAALYPAASTAASSSAGSTAVASKSTCAFSVA